MHFDKMTILSSYLSNAYSEIQHKTKVMLHGSMFYVVSKVETGYQVTVIPHHFNSSQGTARKESNIQINLSENEADQLVEKAKKYQEQCNEITRQFERIHESESLELEQLFQRHLTFLEKFQHGYVPVDEKNKKRFIELLTTYPIATEINQLLGPFSFYTGCKVSFEDKGDSYHVKAIDQRHGDYVAADFEITKIQLRALAKLEYVGLGHQSWILERNLFAEQMRDGSLYLKIENASKVNQIIKQINAAYGVHTCRTSGAGAQYIKINNQTESGIKAITDILDALNMSEVPKYEKKNTSKLSTI